jgi:hypothetical protein
MTIDQAKIIMAHLKKGFSYKEGHYSYGYMTISYNNEKALFEVKKESLAINIFEPDITFEYMNENDFSGYLIKYYDFGKLREYFKLADWA